MKTYRRKRKKERTEVRQKGRRPERNTGNIPEKRGKAGVVSSAQSRLVVSNFSQGSNDNQIDSCYHM